VLCSARSWARRHETSQYRVGVSAIAPPPNRVPFDKLASADLIIDAVYAGGTKGQSGDDPLHPLLGCGLQGGFRIVGKPSKYDCRLAVLYSKGTNPDWPDSLDRETGLLTYYGDNRKPGSPLHKTQRLGNLLLRDSFASIHRTPSGRADVPPFFVFEWAGAGRDVRFLGLGVPGASGASESDDLVAIWRTTAGHRFQNYRATFTILDEGHIQRAWIEDLHSGDPLSANCPPRFRAWVETGKYAALESPRTTDVRTRAEQLPSTTAQTQILSMIYTRFKDKPHGFEACAIELWKMLSRESVSVEATPMSADGGRDGIGLLSLGPHTDRIHLDFSLEAKCYAPGTPVGVSDTKRLLSRLRHRQFGVFITTSYLAKQAYREIREDRHPVVLVTGRDIVETLQAHQYTTAANVQEWLSQFA
jgi:AspBHI-like restriction endonuclease/restriction endonuclease